MMRLRRVKKSLLLLPALLSSTCSYQNWCRYPSCTQVFSFTSSFGLHALAVCGTRAMTAAASSPLERGLLIRIVILLSV
jgi:hypothetical protein